MSKHALLDANGVVKNIIEVDPLSDYTPPEGLSVLWRTACEQAAIGDSWDGAQFIRPVPVVDPYAARYDQAVAYLKSKFGTSRTAAEMNNCIDAICVILKRHDTALDI